LELFSLCICIRRLGVGGGRNGANRTEGVGERWPDARSRWGERCGERSRYGGGELLKYGCQSLPAGLLLCQTTTHTHRQPHPYEVPTEGGLLGDRTGLPGRSLSQARSRSSTPPPDRHWGGGWYGWYAHSQWSYGVPAGTNTNQLLLFVKPIISVMSSRGGIGQCMQLLHTPHTPSSCGSFIQQLKEHSQHLH
jgi:hypothetical protein